MIDFKPGGPDGPPAIERPGLWSRAIGPAIGTIVAAVGIGLIVVAMLWAIAWMITNFPGT